MNQLFRLTPGRREEPKEAFAAEDESRLTSVGESETNRGDAARSEPHLRYRDARDLIGPKGCQEQWAKRATPNLEVLRNRSDCEGESQMGMGDESGSQVHGSAKERIASARSGEGTTASFFQRTEANACREKDSRHDEQDEEA
jgi:hypothetical protein